MFTAFDYDGRAGRALNLEGFTNFQTPISFEKLQKAVRDGKVIVIEPQGIQRLNNDLSKAVESEFDGVDKLDKAKKLISQFRSILVERDGNIDEYLVKVVSADSNLEKSIDSWQLEGIKREGEDTIFNKKGSDIKAALTVVKDKMVAENAILSMTMSTLVGEIGILPDESPYADYMRACGNRYSWEFCNKFNNQSKSIVSVVDTEVPTCAPKDNPCVSYNSAFETFCSNTRSIKACNAYIANLKDNVEYNLTSQLYITLFSE